MTHLSHEELRRWLDSPAEAERGRVVSHLAACDVCAATYAEMVRVSDADVPDTPADVSAFIARGHALRPARRDAAWWATRLVPLAAAAALLLAVVLPREPADNTSLTRGASLQLTSPQGTTATPVEFRWDSSVSASRYLIEVVDSNGRRVLEARTETSPYVLPADLQRQLQPGQDYQWMVTALDARGEALATSPLTPFRIE